MLLSLLALGTGLALLVWSSDKFVFGASALARSLGVSPLLIGLTIVGFGTSAPEMIVSAVSAWQGNPGLAIGNALGSNIANIALILGTSALITPMVVSSGILKKEMPILLAVMVLVLLLLLDGRLGFQDAILLSATMLLVMAWIVYDGLNHPDAQMEKELAEELPANIPVWNAGGWLLIGLVLLLVSSRMMVWGAVNIAQAMGISDLIIGLSIVAIGTSLPELGASIACMRKKEFDIAIGNVMGSNLFNSLGVLGIAGIIQPTQVDSMVLTRDIPIQLGLMIFLFAIAGQWRVGRFSGKGRISRRSGFFLLASFITYQFTLFFQSLAG